MSYLHSILDDCKLLTSSLTYSFVYVKRQCNIAADFMSKYDFSFVNNVRIEEGPVGLGSILLDDQSSSSISNQWYLFSSPVKKE